MPVEGQGVRPRNPARIAPERDTRDVRKDLGPFIEDAPLAPRDRDWRLPEAAEETGPRGKASGR